MFSLLLKDLISDFYLYFPPQLCPLHVVRITVHGIHMYDQVLSHDFRYNIVLHFDVGSEDGSMPNIQHEIFYS